MKAESSNTYPCFYFSLELRAEESGNFLGLLILYPREDWAETQDFNFFVYILLLHKKLFFNAVKTLTLDPVALNSGVKSSLQAS